MKIQHLRVCNIASLSLIILTALPLLDTGLMQEPNALVTVNILHAAAPTYGLAEVPAELLPAVAKTLADRFPDKWRVRLTANQTVTFDNPAQHLTMSFNRDGALLRLDQDQRDWIGLRLTAYSSGVATLPMKPGVLSVKGNRVQISHSHALAEWYVNSPLGVEQGFTLAAPPKATSNDLKLIFSLRGNLMPVQIGNGIEFRNEVGQPVLHYKRLLALDAHNQYLPAELQVEGKKLILEVNATNAVYPVTIDPLFSAVTTFSDPLKGVFDLFGVSVALSADGNTALIGADGTTLSGNDAAGMAYVFTRTNGVWSTTPAQSFVDPVGAQNDVFGESVSLSGDGSTAIISAVGTNNDAGVVYVFTRTNGVWSSTPTQTFADPVGTAGDQFGVRVALSGDGSTALIGANGTTVLGKRFVGAAYVYTRSNGSWPNTPTYSLADPVNDNDGFGSAVALSSDGSIALVGADGTTVSGKNVAGAAYIFTRTNGVWSSSPTYTFTDPRVISGDSFGASVALSSDGTVALIGAASGPPNGVNVGAVYVYAQSDGIWPSAPTQSFIDPLNNANDDFGWSIALSSDGATALIGAYGGVGAAYAYVQNNGIWPDTPTHTFANPVSGGGDGFGIGIALTSDGSGALIGAGNDDAGTAYLYISTADLSLALSSSPANVTVGQDVTYMLTVTNNDPQVTATGLTLTDTLPSGVTFVSANAAGGSCNYANGTVTCTLASIAPQATWQPSITVTAEMAGNVKNSASVSANQTDPNTANNNATVTTTVNTPTQPSSGNGSGGGGAFSFVSVFLLALMALCRKRLRNGSI